jgi:mono/diheme cytochrome c family protein
MKAFIVAAVFGAILWATPAVAQAPDGAALYKQHCKACHGVKGIPSKQMLTIYSGLKALADSGAFAKLPSDSVVAAMQHGRGTSMKAFGDVLTADQMAAVAKFIDVVEPSIRGAGRRKRRKSVASRWCPAGAMYAPPLSISCESTGGPTRACATPRRTGWAAR